MRVSSRLWSAVARHRFGFAFVFIKGKLQRGVGAPHYKAGCLELCPEVSGIRYNRGNKRPLGVANGSCKPFTFGLLFFLAIMLVRRIHDRLRMARNSAGTRSAQEWALGR